MTAFDGLLTSEMVVEVEYESVPDAPSPFSIIFPTPGEEVSELSVIFEWEEATDPDEGDAVSYTLFLESERGIRKKCGK